MLFKCHATHVLRAIWDAEFDGDIRFLIWPEERSTSGQTRSNQVKFQISKFSYKRMPIMCRFVSGSQKSHLFLCTTIRNAKHCISKMWRHHLYLFLWPLHSQKTKILLWNFACMLFVSISITYIPFFWIRWKLWIL